MASTVAYWPMAGENGARMQKDEVIQNLANPDVMDAEAGAFAEGVSFGGGVERVHDHLQMMEEG